MPLYRFEISSLAAVRYRPMGYLRSGFTMGVPQLTASVTGTTNPILLAGPDDEVVNSIGKILHRRITVDATLASGMMVTFRHPLPNFTRVAVSPNGRYFATADEREGRDGSEIDFTLYADSGAELGQITKSFETSPTSEEDVLDRIGDLVGDLSRDLPVASVRNSILNAIQPPDRFPALSSFLLDDAGRLWVGSVAKGGVVIWRAWSVEGDLVETWIVEPGLDVRQIHDGGASAIRRDDVAGWRVVFLRSQAG